MKIIVLLFILEGWGGSSFFYFWVVFVGEERSFGLVFLFWFRGLAEGKRVIGFRCRFFVGRGYFFYKSWGEVS